jgi:short-subunit dehydrogenase
MKRILITGTRGGIGLDAAKRLLALGHTVYATVHHDSSIETLREELSDFGQSAIVEELDVLDASDREKVKAWNIDILINNAAIGNSGPLAEIPIARLAEVFETNVFAGLALAQECIPYMKEQGSGKLIFIGSLEGLVGSPFLAPYSMTKYAVENLGTSLRQELKPLGIDVTLINPGAYHTGFNQKNFAQKNEWFNEQGLYSDHLELLNATEKKITFFEKKSTATIAKKIVKAVNAKNMKRRYSAPFFQSFVITSLRRLVI